VSEQTHRQHSAYGGSVIGRVIACPGSVALCEGLPDSTSSYAEEGTFAHALAEKLLRAGIFDASTAIGDEIESPKVDSTKEVTEEMAGAVQVYLDAVQEEIGRSDSAILEIEQAFVLPIASAAEGEVFGANDALVYHPKLSRLVVFDYKHGAGVSVSAVDNEQLKFYAAGAAFSHPQWTFTEVELVIVQPRARDAEEQDVPGVKRWPMESFELIEFLGTVDLAVARAKDAADYHSKGGASQFTSKLQVGPQCRWCNAAAICPAKQQEVVDSVGLDFRGVEITPQALPVVQDFSTDQIAVLLRGLDVFDAWAKQVRDFAFGLLSQGIAIPGFKLVDKIGRRKWIDDEAQIAGYLEAVYGVEGDDAFPRKLVTITEAERLVKAKISGKAERKEALDDLSLRFTLKESSGQTIAPDTDRRDAVTAGPSADFAGVNIDSAT
jgi:hypothetical protein